MIRHRLPAPLAIFVVGIFACVQPGPRAQGEAEASWSRRDAGQLNGTCVYTVRTRWAASLNHSV